MRRTRRQALWLLHRDTGPTVTGTDGRNRIRGINAQYDARNAPRHHDARDASTSGDVRCVWRRNREEMPAAQKQQREDHCEADSMGSC